MNKKKTDAAGRAADETPPLGSDVTRPAELNYSNTCFPASHSVSVDPVTLFPTTVAERLNKSPQSSNYDNTSN